MDGPARPSELHTGAVASGPAPSRAQLLRETLIAVSSLDGVIGGLLVAPDGLVITSELPTGYAVEALGALAATLGRELELGAQKLGRGRWRTGFFAADDGSIFVGGSSIGIVMLIADRAVSPAAVLGALDDALDPLR